MAPKKALFSHEFYRWLETKGRKWKIIVIGFLSFFNLAATQLKRFSNADIFQSKYLIFATYAAQALIILVLLIYLNFNFHHKIYLDRKHHPHASSAVMQFQHFWVLLWASWFVFYFAFSAQAFLAAAGVNLPWLAIFWDITLGLLNNSQTLFVIACYLVLAEPTAHSKRLAGPLPTLVVILIAVTAVHGITVGVSRFRAEHPNQAVAQEVSPKTSAPPVAVSSITNPPTSPAENKGISSAQPNDSAQRETWGRMIFQLLSGLVAGISLAILAGRFESKYIDAPRLVVVFLYLYAVIQTSFVEFGGTHFQYFQEVMTGISLPLKLLLFLLVTWLLESGKMLFYLENIRNLQLRVNGEWRAFQKGHDEGKGARA